MRSKTKYLLDSKTVRKLCETAGYKDISEIKPLSNGEFNAVYSAVADGKAIAVKIAPPSSSDVPKEFRSAKEKLEIENKSGRI